MNSLLCLNSLVFALSLTCILLVFLINPLLIWMLYRLRGAKEVKIANIRPSVSLITVARNAGGQIADKVRNSLSLDYPREDFEIIIFSDGSTDDTEEVVRPFVNENIRLLVSLEHRGKISGMNRAVEASKGDILFFSDVDTMLEKDAIVNLVKYFGDPEVGGVAGRQTIYKDKQDMEKAQRDYKRFDTSIKSLESLTGSISSNDGTLYAIRKSLFRPIPPAVTDDLYVCLNVVKQKYRFIFEPDVKAYIKGSSRDIAHEIQRRRRIISTS
ncbi:MAG: glycosyltransferase, partial [Nitrospirota bacterium]